MEEADYSYVTDDPGPLCRVVGAKEYNLAVEVGAQTCRFELLECGHLGHALCHHEPEPDTSVFRSCFLCVVEMKIELAAWVKHGGDPPRSVWNERRTRPNVVEPATLCHHDPGRR